MLERGAEALPFVLVDSQLLRGGPPEAAPPLTSVVRRAACAASCGAGRRASPPSACARPSPLRSPLQVSGEGEVEALCVEAHEPTAMRCDASKNAFGSIYHVREPKTRVLSMSAADYAEASGSWATASRLCADVPVGTSRASPLQTRRRSEPRLSLSRALDERVDWEWLETWRRSQGYGPCLETLVRATSEGTSWAARYEEHDQLVLQARPRGACRHGETSRDGERQAGRAVRAGGCLCGRPREARGADGWPLRRSGSGAGRRLAAWRTARICGGSPSRTFRACARPATSRRVARPAALRARSRRRLSPFAARAQRFALLCRIALPSEHLSFCSAGVRALARVAVRPLADL